MSGASAARSHAITLFALFHSCECRTISLVELCIVVCAFAYPTAKIHSRTRALIRPFNRFEELEALFSTIEDMTF